MSKDYCGTKACVLLRELHFILTYRIMQIPHGIQFHHGLGQCMYDM